MDKKIKCIEELITAFKSRNEKLAEEIVNNDDTIKLLSIELEKLTEENNNEVVKAA